MPQLCKICTHHQREAIDGLLLDGWPSLREIGAQYGVSKDSLFRHWRTHVAEAPDGLAPEETGRDDGSSTLKNSEETARQDAEARQSYEYPQPEKSDSEAEAEDAEARYQAFIERWRGRLGIKADEIATWPGGTELLEAAIARGDMFSLGEFYCASVKTTLRFLAG